MRIRKTHRGLTNSRIYQKRKRLYLFSAEPVQNPTTGKVSKWHSLCSVAEGEDEARRIAKTILDHGKPNNSGTGDFGIWFDKWRIELLLKRTEKAPKDPARLEIWKIGTKALGYTLALIENSFKNFDVVQVRTPDVATFVDQWEGRRAAQSYLGHLRKFFAWCCRKGIIEVNPAREITVAKPKGRDVLMEDDAYNDIQKELANGEAPEPAHDRIMTSCYMDLLYLFYQRGTEIRLLRKDQVTGDGILFKPTKTEHTSGKKVIVPIGDDARAVLATAKKVAKMRSIYVFHDEEGQPYKARRLYDVFISACRRAGVAGVTLKDIRAKAATAAKEQGYSEDEVQVGLAHTDRSTTRGYIRSREVPVSTIILKLPKR